MSTDEHRRGALRAAIGLSLQADRRATLFTFLGFGLRPSILVAITYLFKVVVDEAVAGHRQSAVAAAVGIVGCAVVFAAGVPPAIELSVRMIEATSALVDERLMTLVGHLPGVEHLDDPVVLDRLEALRQDRVALSEGADAFSLVLGTLVRAVVTAAVLVVVNPLMLLTPFFAVPMLLTSRRTQRRRSAAIVAAAPQARLARHLFNHAASPSTGKELRLFGLAATLPTRYAGLARDADRAVVRAFRGGLVLSTLAALVFAVGYAGALLVVLHQYRQGHVSIGDVMLTISMVTVISIQVSQAVRFLEFLQQTTAASARLMWLTDYARQAHAETPPGGGAVPDGPLADGIRLIDVGFRYPGSDAYALRGVNLHLPAGSVVAVVGGNGAGKSTLIKLLTRLYRPTEGAVLAGGVDLATVDPQRWQERLSACFQDFARLEFQLRHSVGVGDLARMGDPAVLALAVEQGAAGVVVAALPRGLDTELGASFDGGAELSGGQWQRVALARARMRQTPLLLVLDEPTASIDPIAEDELLNRYITAARATARTVEGITVFASHRLSTASAADLIVVVDNGTVVQVGTHTALMSAGEGEGPYRDLYQRQAKAYA